LVVSNLNAVLCFRLWFSLRNVISDRFYIDGDLLWDGFADSPPFRNPGISNKKPERLLLIREREK
jgi:hypothetical protein